MNKQHLNVTISANAPSLLLIGERISASHPDLLLETSDDHLTLYSPSTGASLNDLAEALATLAASKEVSGIIKILWQDVYTASAKQPTAGATVINLTTGERQDQTISQQVHILEAAVSQPRFWLYCRDCGSVAVAREGTLVWDSDKRLWCEGALYDDSACCECDDGGSVNEHWWQSDAQITDLFAQAGVVILPGDDNGCLQLQGPGSPRSQDFSSLAEAFLWSVSDAGCSLLNVQTAPQQDIYV